MAAIVRAYSHAELCARDTPLILVTCASKDIAEQNYSRFKELMVGRDVGLIMSGVERYSEDIQIVTLDSLHKIRMNEVGITIVDEVHEAATEKRTELLQSATYARRWGASATPTGRYDGSDLLTEGLVGPIVYRRTYPQGVTDGALVPIVVYWVQVPAPHIGLDRYARYKSRKGKYDHGVEKNQAQIDIIAALMKRIPDAYQTLCIMQHTQQMNALAPHLPGVQYVHAVSDAQVLQKQRQYDLTAVSAKARRDLYKQFRGGALRKVMSTYVYKQGVDFPELEVMICAGGGGSAIAAGQIPGRGSRPNPATGKDVAYMIDFWHAWDTDLDKRLKRVPGMVLHDDMSRDKVYSSLGFERHWVDNIEQLPAELLPKGVTDARPVNAG